MVTSATDVLQNQMNPITKLAQISETSIEQTGK
jgi:hypothetical protein